MVGLRGDQDVASPRLFEPACRTPRQIQLASAFCRFRELATVVRL